jgi:predicted transcriptional regulator
MIKEKMPRKKDCEVKQTRTENSGVFIECLADECCTGILELTSRNDYSAMRLSQELNMPSSTVYKKLKRLEDADIVQNVKTLIDRAGNREKYYRCTIQDATVNFDNGKVSVDIKKVDYKNGANILWKKSIEKVYY